MQSEIQIKTKTPGGGGYSLEFLVGCAARISKFSPFSTPVFRRGLKNPYPFSDLHLIA